MKLSDEAKMQALEAAQGIKDAAGSQALWPKAETTGDMETGSPRTPGYDEHTGRTMKPAPQWPQEQPVQPNEQSRDEQTPSATSASADGNAFEQALAEKLQEATTANLEKSRDIDR